MEVFEFYCDFKSYKQNSISLILGFSGIFVSFVG